MNTNANHPKNKTYRVAGSVRGIISYHRTLACAVRSMTSDRRGCRALGGGAYSDAAIQEWAGGRYRPVAADAIEAYGATP